MNNDDKIKNIISFLLIIFHDYEDQLLNAIMSKSPDYLLEKYNRYIESNKNESQWGLHPKLSNILDIYCSRWNVKVNSWEEE